MFNVRGTQRPNTPVRADSASGDRGTARSLARHVDATAGEVNLLARCCKSHADLVAAAEPPPALGLGDIPEDVWGGIAAHLTPVDLLRMGAASQQLREVSRQPACWDPQLAALAGVEAPDASPASPRRAWLEGTAIAHHAPRLLWERSVHGGAGLNAVALSGNTIVTGNANGTARLWELTTGRRRHRLVHGGKVLAVAIAGDTVMTGSDDTTVKLWSVGDGSVQYTLHGHSRAVTAVALGGEVAASGDEGGGLRLWTAAGEPVWNLKAHESTLEGYGSNKYSMVTSIAFCADEVFTASMEGSVGIFAVSDGGRRGSIHISASIATLAVSRDRIVTGTPLCGTVILGRNDNAAGSLSRRGHRGVPLHAVMAGLSLIVGYRDGLAQVESLIDGERTALIDNFTDEEISQVAARGEHIVVGCHDRLRAYVCAPGLQRSGRPKSAA